MNVKIISITQPLIDGINTADELIGYEARISNPSNRLNTDTMPKLIAYCIRNKHWSIFEQACMTVEIETSRAISAQIIRHRSFCFQERSLRYAAAQKFEDIEWRMQGKTNRQVGDEIVGLAPELQIKVKEVQSKTTEVYSALLDAGIAKESARFILPLNTATTVDMIGSVRSWIHYLTIRCEEHTQKEHREIALAIKKIFVEKFPMVAEALKMEAGGIWVN